MNLNQRQTDILNMLIEKGTVYSSELSQKYEVSSETIRKDLSLLDELGYAHKHHGFAVVSEQYSPESLTINSKRSLQSDEKNLIGKRAIDFVEDHSCIYCDCSTTVSAMTPYLGAFTDLTIVTPFLSIVNALSNIQGNVPDVFLIGGYVNYEYESTRCMEFDNSIEQFRFAYAFLGTTGVRYHDGPTSSKYREILVRQRVMKQSDCNIVMCDHSKFQMGGIHQYAKWEDCDYLITDNIPDDKMKEDLEQRVQIIYCND